MKSDLTLSRLMEALSYDHNTGIFTWRTGPRKGTRAGTVMKNGYREIRVFGKRYYEHRLAWLATQGHWPRSCIDHANGNRSDNSARNLRDATMSQNQANSRLHIGTMTGIKGVSIDKKSSNRPFFAQIKIGAKNVRLGHFATSDEARAVRRAAEIRYFGEFAYDGESLR